MGAGGAKLATYSSLQLANQVSFLGREYEMYGTRIIRNGITGADVSGADLNDWGPVHRAFQIIRGDNNSESVDNLMQRLFFLWWETKKHEEEFYWMYDDYPKKIYRFLLEEWIPEVQEN